MPGWASLTIRNSGGHCQLLAELPGQELSERPVDVAVTKEQSS